MTVRVLIVDDSALVREALDQALRSDPDIQVVGAAAHPYEAVEIMRQETVDVLTLDIEMPRMDGLTFLRKIMNQRPLPVVICSTLTDAGAAATIEALELGAVEVVTKPKVGTRAFFEEARIRLCDVVKAAAQVRPRRIHPRPRPPVPKPSAPLVRLDTSDKLICLGASTGGTEALRQLLSGLPVDTPPIAIVQHMPAGFTRAFAARLDAEMPFRVEEAQPGQALLRGTAVVAPGDRHLLVSRSGARLEVELRDGPLVSRHRPSVDVLFRSAARCVGSNVAAAILTGMGKDGARGMKDLREAGAATFAQDEATSVVWGMPGAAVELGGVQEVLSLELLAERLLGSTALARANSR